MGMKGNYVAFENSLLSQIINGDKDIYDIDFTQYPCLDVDKSWQAIQYLLCKDIEGGEPPGGYVVPIRDQNELKSEFDFGIFYITAEQVQEASDYLNSLDDSTVLDMYDFERMKEHGIYPLCGNENVDEAGVFYEYIYSYLDKLKRYFEGMAEKEYAIVFYVM